jgi:hypothetical protein
VKIDRSALVLGTILVLAAAVYVLTRSDDSRALAPQASSPVVAADDTRLERSALAAAAVPEMEAERAATEAPAIETAEPASADDARVRGRVVDQEDHGIPGASIVVDYKPGDDFNILDLAYSHQEIAVGTTETDSEGAFAIEVPPDWPMRVHARARGYSSALLTDVFAGADLTIVLGPSATLLGRITRERDGSPVADAEVHLFHLGGPSYGTVHSDSDGNYRLPDMPPGAATIEISTSWLADPEWTSIDLPPGAHIVHDVVLRDGVSIFGVVKDARTGAPIADAEVGAGWFYSRSVRTSPTGEYEVRGFGTPGVNEVFIRARGYADARHEFPWTRMPSERTQLDFALDPAHRARGRVIDAAGQPVEGVYVAAVSGQGASGTSDWKSTRTDTSGLFVIESLHPTHQHGLFLRATGWANLAYAFPPTEREIEDLDLGTFTLQRPGSLAGVVVDEQSEIVADVEVSLRGTNTDSGKLLGGVYRPTLPDNLESRSVRTDAAGRFHFGDLAAGNYGVNVSRRTGTPAQQPPVKLAEGERRTDVRFVLPSSGRIRGRVETADGAPLAGAEVHATPDGRANDSSPYLRARCESGGVFEIDGLEAESYTLRVERGWLDAEHAKDCASTQVKGVHPGEAIVLVLAPAAPIEGQVLTAEGRLAEGTWVSASLDGLYLDSAYCDAAGRFRLLVPQGTSPQITVRPTVRSDDWNGWTILEHTGGIDLINVPAGAENLEVSLPAR